MPLPPSACRCRPGRSACRCSRRRSACRCWRRRSACRCRRRRSACRRRHSRSASSLPPPPVMVLSPEVPDSVSAKSEPMRFSIDGERIGAVATVFCAVGRRRAPPSRRRPLRIGGGVDAVAAIQRVVAVLADQRVVVVAAVQRVVVGAAVQRVVARVAVQRVVAGVALQRRRCRRRRRGVVAGVPDSVSPKPEPMRFSIDESVSVPSPPVFCAPERERHGHAGGRARIGGRVVPPPPFSVSLPSWPISVSLSSPPFSVSLPAPPFSVSSPPRRSAVSLPAYALTLSIAG